MQNNHTLHLGDNLATLRTYPDDHFDSIVTDPPYGIAFLGKDWDKHTGTLELYKECLRVLKPGGYMLAFSAARTYHQLASNIELAGFEIRDQLMWLYSSGFPKAQDIGKAIDKRAGKVDPNYGTTNNNGTSGGINLSFTEDHIGGSRRCVKCKKDVAAQYACQDDDCGMVYKPQTRDGQEWAGWKTSLKPAEEPIVVARKPCYNIEITIQLENLCSLVKSAAHNSKDITIQKISQTETFTALINARNQFERILQGQEKNIPEVMSLFMMETATGNTSIVSLWQSIWVDHLQEMKKFITETKTSTIIELKTLNCLLKVITQEYTTQDQIGASIQNVNVITAALNLCDLLLKLLLTQRLTAQEIATETPDNNPNKHEPIVMARKPFKGSTIDNVLKNGLGAMNIDATRIPWADAAEAEADAAWREKWSQHNVGAPTFAEDDINKQREGKKKKSDKEVRLQKLNQDIKTCGYENNFKGIEGQDKEAYAVEYTETDVAAMSQGRYPSNVIGEVQEGYQKYFYCPKVSRKERHSGFTELPEPDPSGKFDRSEQPLNANERIQTKIGNNHPTVKPVALMDYLIKLVTPPSTPTLQRKVLDPFMGSGSTGMAATALGHHFTGCELDPKYVAIAEIRIEAWTKPSIVDDPDTTFDDLFAA